MYIRIESLFSRLGPCPVLLLIGMMLVIVIDILHDQQDLLISTEKLMYRDLPILGLVFNYDQ